MRPTDKINDNFLSKIFATHNQMVEVKSDNPDLNPSDDFFGDAKGLLHNIIESSLDGIIAVDNQGHIRRMNRSFLKTLGYEAHEIVGKHVAELSIREAGTYELTTGDSIAITEDYFCEHGAFINKLAQGDEIINRVSYFTCKDGKIIPCEQNISSLYNDEGEVIGAVGVVRNITDRRNAQKSIEEFREFLDNIFKTVVDGIIVTDPKGYIIMLNDAVETITGYSRENLIGRNAQELRLGGSENDGNNKGLFEKVFGDDNANGSEIPWMRKDGKIITIERRFALLKDKKENIAGAVATIRDTTVRSNAQKELREAKEHLDNLIENSLDCIMVSDKTGNITKVNKYFLDLLGYSKQEIIGKHIMECAPMAEEGAYECTTGEVVRIDKEFTHDAQIRIADLLEKGNITNWETYYCCKDKKVIPVEQNVVCLYNKEGERTGAVAVIRDITLRRKAEKELKETKEFLEKVIENTKDGILIVDEKGYVLSANTAMEKITGFGKKDMIGQHTASLVVDDKEIKKAILEKIPELYEKGFTTYEAQYKTNIGEYLDVECTSSMICNDQGEYIAGVAVLRDISERKKIEGELRAINGQLIAREQKLRSINQQLQTSNQQLRDSEFALRESEEKYRLSTENIPVHIGAIDQYGKFMLWNKYSENMLGYKADEVIGKLFSSAIHESKEEADEVMRIASANGIYDKEINLVHKNKSLVPVHLVVVPKKTEGGEITGFYGFAEDITERKKAEEAIRKSEEKYHNLIQNANDGIITIDEHGIIIGFNNKAEELFGYRPDEVMGIHVALLTPEDKREGEEKVLAYFRNSKLLTTHGKIVEREGLRKDGSKIPLEATWSALKVGNGYIITSIVRDVSERKKAEKEIWEAKEFLEKVIESSKDGIIITDEKGRMLSVNKAITEMSGFTKEELIGQQTTLFVAEDEVVREKILQKMAELFKKGFSSYESTFRNRAGALVEIECNSSLMKDDKGNAIAGVTVFRDVTERNKIEKQLHQSEKLKSLGELAGGVAHDFNNVLAAILGRVQLLRTRLASSSGELQRGLDVIEKASLDGAETVRRIQEFARNRADKKGFHLVDINELLENVLDFTRPKWKDEAEAKGIKFCVKKDLSLLPSTMASASELREVFTNLINNAFDAMTPQGGQLTIKSSIKDNYIHVVIMDSGVGMPKEVREKIFDPFFTTKGSRSTGLGLSVSYGIIKRHKGTIKVDSEEGKGTSFTIMIPVMNKEIKEVKIEFTPIANRKAKILIIDDEEEVRNVIQDILTDAGHHVESAGDGLQGINLFKGNEYSMVFTDLGMPSMSGWQVAEEIKHINKMTPVALITGWNVDIMKTEMKKNNVDFIIKKPFVVNQLLRLVQEGLELQERFHAA